MDKFVVTAYGTFRKEVEVEAETKDEAIKQGFLMIMENDPAVVVVEGSSRSVDASKVF